jgi:hypothetical protein
MCTPLWIACADTPFVLCAAWGQRWGHLWLLAGARSSACCYVLHRLCGRKTFALGGQPEQPEVIHTRRMTGAVPPRRGRAAGTRAARRQPAQVIRPIRLRAVGRPGYRSSVCSTPEAALDELARAIDELAADSGGGAAAGQLAERIARLWGMISDLDPELARRRSGYERPTDE